MRSLHQYLILSLLLTGCPDSGVATLTDAGSTGGQSTDGGYSETSAQISDTVIMSDTGAPTPTTGLDDHTSGSTGGACSDLEEMDQPSMDALCEAHPWAWPDGCTGPAVPCRRVAWVISNTRACDGIDSCSYAACADALSASLCGDVPPACEAIMACLGYAPEPLPDCCSMNGSVPGLPGICGISRTVADPADGLEMKCVDCNFWPVLCQDSGCGTANEKDCCLNDAGETVTCSDEASSST